MNLVLNIFIGIEIEIEPNLAPCAKLIQIELLNSSIMLVRMEW